MTTRPPSNDPADVAAWEEERARLREEREFRSRADQFFGESRADARAIREDITAIRGEMAAHESRDKERFAEMEGKFGGVHQSIGGTDNKLHWIIGIGAGVMAAIGMVALYLSLRATP